MNLKELSAAISEDAGFPASTVEAVIGYACYHIAMTVVKGEWVELRGFGRFRSAKRAMRRGRNPKTGAVMSIPATTVPVFRPGAAFKESVAAKRPGDKGMQKPSRVLSIEK